MKVVLDANIFVSAAVWGGNPRKITKRVSDGLDTLFIVAGDGGAVGLGSPPGGPRRK